MPKIFETLDKVRPFYDIAYKVLMFICKILLVVDIILTTYAVAARYLTQIPGVTLDSSWAEQIVTTLMAYMAVLSAALAIRRNAHIRMTAFDNKLPRKVVMSLDVLADVAVLVLGYIMLTVGYAGAVKVGKIGNFESLPWLSRFWLYFPIPVAGVAMIIFELEALYNHIKAFFLPEEKKEA